jgi:hypothetical protein
MLRAVHDFRISPASLFVLSHSLPHSFPVILLQYFHILQTPLESLAFSLIRVFTRIRALLRWYPP